MQFQKPWQEAGAEGVLTPDLLNAILAELAYRLFSPEVKSRFATFRPESKSAGKQVWVPDRAIHLLSGARCSNQSLILKGNIALRVRASDTNGSLRIPPIVKRHSDG